MNEEVKKCGRCSKIKKKDAINESKKEICNCGRPIVYTKELGKKICRKISRGESLRSIVKDKNIPNASTIFSWLLDKRYKEFSKQYETARNVQAETMFEELIEIADSRKKDVMRDRLRVDTRKWYLSKVLPKKFGDKLDLTTAGDKLPTPILSGRANKKKNDH